MIEVQEHMIAAHKTDKVNLDLSAFCTCDSEMRHTITQTMGDGFRDYFHCDKCGNEGFVERTK